MESSTIVLQVHLYRAAHAKAYLISSTCRGRLFGAAALYSVIPQSARLSGGFRQSPSNIVRRNVYPAAVCEDYIGIVGSDCSRSSAEPAAKEMLDCRDLSHVGEIPLQTNITPEIR
jgi:hypothetical protein